jgi:hypothetical protein
VPQGDLIATSPSSLLCVVLPPLSSLVSRPSSHQPHLSSAACRVAVLSSQPALSDSKEDWSFVSIDNSRTPTQARPDQTNPGCCPSAVLSERYPRLRHPGTHFFSQFSPVPRIHLRQNRQNRTARQNRRPHPTPGLTAFRTQLEPSAVPTAIEKKLPPCAPIVARFLLVLLLSFFNPTHPLPSSAHQQEDLDLEPSSRSTVSGE